MCTVSCQYDIFVVTLHGIIITIRAYLLQVVVINEVDSFLFRPHLGLRAKYHAVGSITYNANILSVLQIWTLLVGPDLFTHREDFFPPICWLQILLEFCFKYLRWRTLKHVIYLKFKLSC